MAHCSAKWNEFKFCMSIKGLHPEQRRDAWIRRRAEWWARRRLGLSSENVWEMRAYVTCLITTTNMSVLSNASSEPLRELPTTFTPTRCHGGTCRMNLIFGPIYRFAALVFDLLGIEMVGLTSTTQCRIHRHHWITAYSGDRRTVRHLYKKLLCSQNARRRTAQRRYAGTTFIRYGV